MRFPPVLSGFPHIVHGADYNPDQWMDPAVWDEDMRIAKKAGMNSLSVGIFSWAQLEPEEGRYTFEWLDRIMDRLAQNGIKAILATPSGARPAWMSQKYTEVLRVTDQGQRRQHGGRHNHCLTSPVYREKVTQINTLLAERYKDHPALGAWHISNEYGGECFCPLCQAAFREWLKRKYQTLENLNHAWWTAFWSHTYTDWSQIEAPSSLGESFVHGLTLDWKRFTTDQFIDFYRHETEPLKRITPNVPCTTNLMGTYLGINYFKLAKELDFASWDAYPQWTGRTDEDVQTAVHFSFQHDLTRSHKQKPFFLMESSPSATNWRPYARLHRPGVHTLQSMQALAHGADSVQYFQFRKSRGSSEKFHGAVVDHVGHEDTRVSREIIALGEKLKGLSAIQGLDNPARVALVYDWENAWAIEDARGLNNEDKKYLDVLLDHYRALWQMGVNVDIIDEDGSPEGYDVVIAPMLYLLRAGFAQKLEAFVKQGGTLVSGFITGYVDENDLCFLGGFPGPLKETLGVWAEEVDVLLPGERNHMTYGPKSYALQDYAELIHLEGAQALAGYESDFYRGMPAVSVNHYGEGNAYYLSARGEPAFYIDFYRKLLSELNIETKALPYGCTAVTRSDGEESYLFLLNFAAEPCQVDATGEDALTGEKLNSVALPGHGFAILKQEK
jgi:beta-galactosidase